MNLKQMSTEELEASVELLTEMKKELEARKQRDYLNDLNQVLKSLKVMDSKYGDKHIKRNGLTWHQLFCEVEVNQEY